MFAECLPYKRTSHLEWLKLWANLTQTPPLIPPLEIFVIMSVDPFHLKRLFTMPVVSDEHPSNLNLLFVSCDSATHSKMTSLFRPWTEDKSQMKNLPDGMTSLFLEQPVSELAADSSARETKYKTVKEHMKKRSEKYLMKKLKVRLEKTAAEMEKSEVTGLPDSSGTEVNATKDSFPVCCVSPEGYLTSVECFLPRTNFPGVGFPGAEFLDIVSGQAFSSGVFEEYARFLTEQQRIVSERSRKQRPKKFRCPHCHVGFSNNGQLKGHIRIHTGERPFKCDAESCGKSFTRNEELTRHRRIHSGLRPFPCPECGKRFGRKDHLKKHVKTHFQQRYQLVPILPTHCPYFYGL